MVRDGYFGYKEYFKSLCDTVEIGKDFYLLGADFSSYLEAQVFPFFIVLESKPFIIPQFLFNIRI